MTLPELQCPMTLQHVMDADTKGLLGTCCIMLVASIHTQPNPAHTGICTIPQLEL